MIPFCTHMYDFVQQAQRECEGIVCLITHRRHMDSLLANASVLILEM